MHTTYCIRASHLQRPTLERRATETTFNVAFADDEPQTDDEAALANFARVESTLYAKAFANIYEFERMCRRVCARVYVTSFAARNVQVQRKALKPNVRKAPTASLLRSYLTTL